MGLLEHKQPFNHKWVEDKSRQERFDNDDLNAIIDIEVVPPKDPTYRCNSAKVKTYGGDYFYSLTLDSNDIPIGTKLDKNKCLICLFRWGDIKTCEKLRYVKDEPNIPF